MKAVEILKHAETLDHDQRWKYMVGLGRMAGKDAALADSLAELAASGVHYERMLVAMSAHGSHDREIIAQLLEDASSVLASGIVKLAARHLGTDKLIALAPRLPKHRRQRLFHALALEGRTTVVERLYGSLNAQAQREALPFASETFVREHLDGSSVESLPPIQWSRLAQRFPALAGTLLQNAMGDAAEPSWPVQQALRIALLRMLRADPDTGLKLLECASVRMDPKTLFMERYACLFPSVIAELLAKHPSRPSIELPASVLRRLECETLCALAEAGIQADLEGVFPELRPDQRAALYRCCGESWRGTGGEMPIDYVRKIPAPQREAEALHAFRLPLLQSQPMVRAGYLAVLPYAQARPLAEPFLAQPEGELRAQAVAALVEGGRYHASGLDDILDFCIARENEQDPVRLAMIEALAGLPPTRWRPPHLPRLKRILEAALRARDCSFQTMEASARLLLGMIVPQTDFVVAELPGLVERMGRLYMVSQESRMTDGEMLRLAPCLIPLLKTWIARDRSSLALGLISSFGRRTKAVPDFARLMIELTGDTRGPVARSGLDCLIRLEFRKEAAELIPQLLQQDASWIQVHTVARHLHRHRQSLLTPFLTPRIYKGRFSTGGTAVLPGFDDGFMRWTAGQQGIYADSLQSIIESKKRNAWELYQIVRRLGAMPSADLAPLVRLARLDAKDAALRDKSLEALGRADAGRGVQTLLESLDDARARVAIYALRRSLLVMPARNALKLLAGVPRGKVTVTKEVIRLAGEFEGEEAYDFLRGFAADEKLHPDAQIALLRAFWQHLDREEVWHRLHAAARGERGALARATIRIPQEGLSPEGRQRLCRHLTLLLQHTDAQVRRETLERLIAMPPGRTDPAMRDALAGLLEDIDQAVCQLAAEALLAAYAVQDSKALAGIFAAVIRARSLLAIVDAYERRRNASMQGLQASARALADALLTRRWQLAQAARLALTVPAPADGLGIIRRIAAADLLHPGVVESGLDAWTQAMAGRQQTELDAVEANLGAAADPGLRRLGLGLLCRLVDRHGWTDARRARLQNYRSDEAPWVSEAAELIADPPPVCITNPHPE